MTVNASCLLVCKKTLPSYVCMVMFWAGDGCQKVLGWLSGESHETSACILKGLIRKAKERYTYSHPTSNVVSSGTRMPPKYKCVYQISDSMFILIHHANLEERVRTRSVEPVNCIFFQGLPLEKCELELSSYGSTGGHLAERYGTQRYIAVHATQSSPVVPLYRQILQTSVILVPLLLLR